MGYFLSEREEFFEICIIDWYDGIVSAVGTRFGEDWLVSLLAWEQRSDQRVYVLVQIDQAVGRRLRSLASNTVIPKQQRWDAIQSEFAELRKGVGGTAVLTRCRQFNDGSTATAEVEVDDTIRSRLGLGVEAALDHQDKWFPAFDD